MLLITQTRAICNRSTKVLITLILLMAVNNIPTAVPTVPLTDLMNCTYYHLSTPRSVPRVTVRLQSMTALTCEYIHISWTNFWLLPTQRQVSVSFFLKRILTSTYELEANNLSLGFTILFDVAIVAMTLHQTLDTLVQGTRKEEWVLSILFTNRSLIGVLVRQGKTLQYHRFTSCVVA